MSSISGDFDFPLNPLDPLDLGLLAPGEGLDPLDLGLLAPGEGLDPDLFLTSLEPMHSGFESPLSAASDLLSQGVLDLSDQILMDTDDSQILSARKAADQQLRLSANFQNAAPESSALPRRSPPTVPMPIKANCDERTQKEKVHLLKELAKFLSKKHTKIRLLNFFKKYSETDPEPAIDYEKNTIRNMIFNTPLREIKDIAHFLSVIKMYLFRDFEQQELEEFLPVQNLEGQTQKRALPDGQYGNGSSSKRRKIAEAAPIETNPYDAPLKFRHNGYDHKLVKVKEIKARNVLKDLCIDSKFDPEYFYIIFYSYFETDSYLEKLADFNLAQKSEADLYSLKNEISNEFNKAFSINDADEMKKLVIQMISTDFDLSAHASYLGQLIPRS